MSWHYLQGQEAESWEASSLDGAPSALLSLIPMPARSSSPASGTASLSPSQSGTTFAPSEANSGGAESKSCLAGSLARTFPQVGRGQDLTENAPVCGESSPGSSVKCVPLSFSSKTAPALFPEDWTESLGTLPAWGSMQFGELSGRKPWAFPTNETESGSWPTPKARDHKSGGTSLHLVRARVESRPSHGCLDLSEAAVLAYWRPGMTGLLNPCFSESLMGWPIGWTDLEPLETARFQEWFNSHFQPYTTA